MPHDRSDSSRQCASGRISARLRHRATILGRFSIIGVFAAGIDIAFSNVLFFIVQLGPVTSKAIAMAIATTVAFIGNREWTFQQREFSRSARAQYVRFWMANLIGFAINVSIVAAGSRMLDLDDLVTYNLVANVVGIGLATTVRFVLYAKWVFTSIRQ